jgi:hypothetical protein
LEQRRAEMVERVAAQAAEAAKAEAKITAETEAPVRTKARDGAGGRLPHGIYRGSTPGTYRADAGRDPKSGKRRRKDGFATVAEAETWRERSLAADSTGELAVIDFTAKLPLAFGRALWDVKTRLKAKQSEAERRASKLAPPAGSASTASAAPTQLGNSPIFPSGSESASAARGNGGVQDVLPCALFELPAGRFEFSPELLVEMATFWIERHPKGQAGVTFSRAAELWLASKKLKKVRPRTYGDCKDGIEFWAGSLGSRRCVDISTADLEAVLAKKRGEVGALRVRNLIVKVSALFTWLQTIGQLAPGDTNNPASGVVRPMIDEDVPTPFTVDEASALLSLALQTQAELGCMSYVAVGLFAGARFTEMTRLKWGQHIAGDEELRRYRLPATARLLATAADEDYDDDEDDEEENELLLRVTPDVAKKRRQRLVQMPPNLCAILLEMQKRGWIQPGQPLLPPERKQKLFRRFAEANGIAWKDNGLRSGFGSHYFAATGSVEATVAAMGHTGDAATFRNHYFKLCSRKQGRRYFKLGFAGLDSIPVFPLKVTLVDWVTAAKGIQTDHDAVAA